MKPLTFPAADSQPTYNTIDPLDGRYFDPEIARYLSESSRVTCQAYVEAALAHTLAEFGICSSKVAEQIEAASQKVKIADVYEEEKTTKHDIKALVNCIKRELPDEAKPYVHFGATSYDIISSASALQMRYAISELVAPRLHELITTLAKMADEYAETVQIGRTHGQHGLPITFGLMLAQHASRLHESCQALVDLAQMIPGKFSGAVGAYNALSLFVDDPMAFEKSVMDKLGLRVATASTQIAPAEYTIRLVDELAITAGIMANISHDMRHLQRSEIAEVRERFEPGQTGSSTMAHKRNPWNFENIISMSKQVTAQIINANLNISSEHQRDLTDSASARFYPIALASVASMAERLNRVMGKLEVDEQNMQRNLHLTQGAIAAEPLYLLLEKYGHTAAHEAAKQIAHNALQQGKSLYEAASTDPEIAGYWQKLTPTEKSIIQSPESHYTGLATQKTRAILRQIKNQN